ncbi:MAG: DUF2586 family protein [Bacteroidota bacterium]
MLPRVKIIFENGALGSVIPSPDGVLGVLCSGVTVSDTFVLATPYILKSFADLKNNLGITVDNNPNIVKFFTDFYAMAGDGTEVWLMAFADTVSMTEMVDTTQDYAMSLLKAANGRLRGLIVTRTPGIAYTPVIAHALDDDCETARLKAQQLAEYAANTLMAPVFAILEGRSFTGQSVSLADLTEEANNRVGILIGDTVVSSENACMGMLAGRIASIPVQRNIGRVKDGPIETVNAFLYDKKVENADPGSIHDKGYITLRTFVGRAGYFFSDDTLATAVDDDYRSLTARRTIDKAYRIAYDTLLDELLDEIPVNEDGTMQVTMVKSWQGKVENAIALQMTANGELSADVTNPNDRGVECFIDATQNVVSTSRVNARVRVRPFGYSRYIDVYLGFKAVVV